MKSNMNIGISCNHCFIDRKKLTHHICQPYVVVVDRSQSSMKDGHIFELNFIVVV